MPGCDHTHGYVNLSPPVRQSASPPVRQSASLAVGWLAPVQARFLERLLAAAWNGVDGKKLNFAAVRHFGSSP